MSYWKEINLKTISSLTKKRFARFSKGEFEKEPITFNESKNKITIKTGPFDWHELLEIACKLNPVVQCEGKYISSSELPLNGKYNKTKKVYEYEIKGQFNISEILDMHGYFLGKMKNDLFELKTKKSLPKPSELKDDFARLDVSNSEKTKEIICDIFQIEPQKLKGMIKYKIFVESIELPANLNDPLIREKAKRTGKIEREILLEKEKREILEFEI